MKKVKMYFGGKSGEERTRMGKRVSEDGLAVAIDGEINHLARL